VTALAEATAGGRFEQEAFALPRVARVEAGDDGPLTFAQERVWLIQQLTPQAVAYNFEAKLHFCGELRVALLERCLRELVERHSNMQRAKRWFRDCLDKRLPYNARKSAADHPACLGRLPEDVAALPAASVSGQALPPLERAVRNGQCRPLVGAARAQRCRGPLHARGSRLLYPRPREDDRRRPRRPPSARAQGGCPHTLRARLVARTY